MKSLTRSSAAAILAQTAVVAALGCASKGPGATVLPSKYLFVWAGPPGHTAAGGSDFLVVIDANPESSTYSKILTSTEVGTPGAMAHHTELSLPVGHPLFASDYLTGQIFLLDVANPLAPHLSARIDSVPGYRRAHSFARRSNGNVLTAMQNGNATIAGDPGGLAEFDPAGHLLRTSPAADSSFPGARIRPNGIELLPAIDRIVTTSMPMDDEHTADVVQIWRLSDLRLLHTLAMPQSPGDSTGSMPYDTRVLADGRSVMLNTYFCGFYHVSAIETDHPRVDLVAKMREPRSEGCAVAIIASHYWVVPVASGRAIVSLDVADPSHPVEVSRLQTETNFKPHWISMDRGSDRIVVTSTDEGESRVVIAHLDRTSGRLSWDEQFRDAGSARRGVSFDRETWPHGQAAHVMAHAALFGPAPPRGVGSQSVVGRWALVSLVRNGEDRTSLLAAASAVRYYTFNVDGTFRIMLGDSATETGRWSQDTTVSPKIFDHLPDADGKPGPYVPGIFAIRGDTLTISLIGPNPERRHPTQFRSVLADSSWLLVSRRAPQ